MFDAVNELGAHHGARQLRWLPATPPPGCTIVLSAIEPAEGVAADDDPPAEVRGPLGSIAFV